MAVKKVAGHLDLKWKMVKNINKSILGAQYGSPRFDRLRLLAVDENSIRKGHRYLTVNSDRLAQHAEFRSPARGRRNPKASFAETRGNGNHRGVFDGAEYILSHGNTRVILLRARYSHLREGDAQRVRHQRDPSIEIAHAPPDHCRSLARHWQVGIGQADFARGRSSGREWPDRRSPYRPGACAQRWRAIAQSQQIRPIVLRDTHRCRSDWSNTLTEVIL